MIERVRVETVKTLYLIQPAQEDDLPRRKEQRITLGRGQVGGEGESQKQQTVHRKEAKVGRNEPCPCGSGKKYKKCCGKAA